MRRSRIFAVPLLLALGCSGAPEPAAIDWTTDRIASFDDQAIEIDGEPSVIESPFGPALYFDGQDDALQIDSHPLQGAGEFTIEMLFRPDSGGSSEQRVLHLQQDDSSDRILLETRLVGEQWFMDSYIKSDDEGYTLFAREHLHPLDQWFHVALVVDGERMTQYVNRRRELTRKIEFLPPATGRTSLGVRINHVDWFRGAVRRIRFTPSALSPDEFFAVEPDSD